MLTNEKQYFEISIDFLNPERLRKRDFFKKALL